MKRVMLPKNTFASGAQGFEDLLVYGVNIADGVILNSDAGMMKSWRIRGRDMESCSSAELAAQSRRLNDVVRRLPEGWMLHVDSIRRPAIGYPMNSRFPDRTSWLIDEERRADYSRTDAHFVSQEILTATYLCERDQAAKAWRFFMDSDARDPREGTRLVMMEALREFERGIDLIEQGFREDLSPVPLQCRLVDHPGGAWLEDPQLRHLIFCATGIDVPIHAKPVKTELAPVVGAQHLRNGDRLLIGNKVVAVLSLEDTPSHSHPGILDILNQQACSYRVSSRFILMDKLAAQKEIAIARRKHHQGRKSVAAQLMGSGEPVHADGDALYMSADASAALDECKAGVVSFGWWSTSVVFMEEIRAGETEAAASLRLDLSLREVASAINRLGFVTRTEETNTLEAFIGTLPGHGHANVRRAMLSSKNLVEFLPTTSPWTGEPYCPSPMYPAHSPPLAVVRTTGTMPFYFNLHVGDVAHTMITGPTGAGKSTLLAFLLAQHRRYPGARQIAIDLGFSLYTLCQAVGGEHHNIATAAGPTFAPLEFIDDPAERSWAESWVGLLLQQQNVALTSERREGIALALESLAHASSRSLTDLTMQPYLDQETRRALHWYTIDREGGGLLDARHTALSSSDFTVFEMEALRELGKPMMVPALTYLFHLIERWLKSGTPTLFVIDEVWALLDDPQQAEQLKEWLKTMRKKNVGVVFATQSLEEVLSSDIHATLVQSCPTKIYLANPEADSQEQRSAYASFGLTDWQISMIARATAKRDYYVTQPQGKRLISLDLQPPALAFLGVSDTKEITRVQALIAADRAAMEAAGTPNSALWPMKWLRARADEDWARYWAEGPEYARGARILAPPQEPLRNGEVASVA
jgi:type IV secretion system protein VirB4